MNYLILLLNKIKWFKSIQHKNKLGAENEVADNIIFYLSEKLTAHSLMMSIELLNDQLFFSLFSNNV